MFVKLPLIPSYTLTYHHIDHFIFFKKNIQSFTFTLHYLLFITIQIKKITIKLKIFTF